MAVNEILQAETAYEAAIPALVALVVKVHLLVERESPVRETVPVRTFAMAVEPVGTIDTQVAETTQTLSAKAERRHHWQLQVVVSELIVHITIDHTRVAIVLLGPVQVGTHAQPVGHVVLSGDAQGNTPASVDLIVGHVLLIHVEHVVVSTASNTYPPLGLGRCDHQKGYKSHYNLFFHFHFHFI